MFCRKFIGKQLIECMNQLENDEYKFSLMKLDSIKKQRYYYLKNTLQTAKDLEKFGARFSSEEWEKIWNDFSKEEKEIFASYLGTIASTKENLDSLTTEKNVIEWIYWPFKGIVEKISKDVQWLTKND